MRGNGLRDLSLQEEFGETSKQETKKSPKLYNLKIMLKCESYPCASLFL